MISAYSVGLNAWGTPSITAPGGMICACDAWSMQPEQRIVRGRLDAAVHQAGRAELDLILQPQPAPAVHHPERAAGRGHGRDRSVQELDVKLGGLNVRFRQIGDLGHQLADLVFCLLEQTGINGFFRHGGTSG